MQKEHHKQYIDIIRVLATVLVILNHLPIYMRYMDTSGINQWEHMFFTMFIRCNVPLFFMISGALLLGKTETFRTTFRKRIARMTIVLFIFEYLVYIATAMANNVGVDGFCIPLSTFLKMCLAGDMYGTYSYWYIYAYIGMLCLLPFLSILASQMKKQEFYLLVALHFLIQSFLPIVNLVLKINCSEVIEISHWISVPLAVESAFFFPLVGYYLDYNVEIERVQYVFCMIGLGVGIILPAIATYVAGCHFGYTEDYVQLFDYVTAFAVFLLIKKLVVHHNMQLKIFTRLAKLCFGIYLMDPIWKMLISEEYEYFRFTYFNWVSYSVGWCLVSIFLGGMTTFVLKKVPGVGKLF